MSCQVLRIYPPGKEAFAAFAAELPDPSLNGQCPTSAPEALEAIQARIVSK